MRQAALILALGLVACRTTMIYDKPGASPDDFHRDNGSCEAYARAAAVPYEGRNIYDACMRGKGWYRQKDEAPRRSLMQRLFPPKAASDAST